MKNWSDTWDNEVSENLNFRAEKSSCARFWDHDVVLYKDWIVHEYFIVFASSRFSNFSTRFYIDKDSDIIDLVMSAVIFENQCRLSI